MTKRVHACGINCLDWSFGYFLHLVLLYKGVVSDAEEEEDQEAKQFRTELI